MSLLNPTKAVDFHMGTDSLNFACQECHTTNEHQIAGNSLIVYPGGNTSVTCEGCHDAAPHSESVLNNHARTVACQTCHIPSFAKIDATKMSWDWSKAEKGKPVEKEHGHKVYMVKKGAARF